MVSWPAEQYEQCLFSWLPLHLAAGGYWLRRPECRRAGNWQGARLHLPFQWFFIALAVHR
jgi:hypothetical protein